MGIVEHVHNWRELSDRGKLLPLSLYGFGPGIGERGRPVGDVVKLCTSGECTAGLVSWDDESVGRLEMIDASNDSLRGSGLMGLILWNL